jgi:arylformamidase
VPSIRLDDGRLYYDISPEISAELAVFPGDTPFSRKVSVDFEGGANYLASSIHGTVHLGAHVDAPNHYAKPAEGIETRPLDAYFGDCQIISVTCPRSERIRLEHIPDISIRARRVIFKTSSFPNPNRWNGDFNSLSAPLIRALSDQGVVLIGIDTPSIDPSDEKVLESHSAVFERNMAIIEGVVLDEVPDGVYTLVALPLKIKGADASPVRAILIEKRDEEKKR